MAIWCHEDFMQASLKWWTDKKGFLLVSLSPKKGFPPKKEEDTSVRIVVHPPPPKKNKTHPHGSWSTRIGGSLFSAFRLKSSSCAKFFRLAMSLFKAGGYLCEYFGSHNQKRATSRNHTPELQECKLLLCVGDVLYITLLPDAVTWGCPLNSHHLQKNFQSLTRAHIHPPPNKKKIGPPKGRSLKGPGEWMFETTLK